MEIKPKTINQAYLLGLSLFLICFGLIKLDNYSAKYSSFDFKSEVFSGKVVTSNNGILLVIIGIILAVISVWASRESKSESSWLEIIKELNIETRELILLILLMVLILVIVLVGCFTGWNGVLSFILSGLIVTLTMRLGSYFRD